MTLAVFDLFFGVVADVISDLLDSLRLLSVYYANQRCFVGQTPARRTFSLSREESFHLFHPSGEVIQLDGSGIDWLCLSLRLSWNLQSPLLPCLSLSLCSRLVELLADLVDLRVVSVADVM